VDLYDTIGSWLLALVKNVVPCRSVVFLFFNGLKARVGRLLNASSGPSEQTGGNGLSCSFRTHSPP